MVSVVCVVIHPSRLAREGLASILASSPFAPACTAARTEEVPRTIASASEQVVVILGVREAINLAQVVSTARVSFPDAPIVVIGNPCDGELVLTALAAGATTFIDESVSTTTLIAQLELVAQGEPVISVSLIKRLLGRALRRSRSKGWRPPHWSSGKSGRSPRMRMRMRDQTQSFPNARPQF